MTFKGSDYEVIIYHNLVGLQFIACACVGFFFHKINLRFLNLIKELRQDLSLKTLNEQNQHFSNNLTSIKKLKVKQIFVKNCT